MIDSPLISVIIPSNKIGPELDRCLESVMHQTYNRLEILLVINGAYAVNNPDDIGENDYSAYLFSKYEKYDARIKVLFSLPGVANARNKGVQESNGEYIGFADSDDIIEPEMYERLYRSIVDDESDISVCAYFYDTSKRSTVIKSSRGVYDRISALKLLAENDIESFSWNKLFRRELFEGVSFPQVAIYEDVAVMHILFNKAGKVSVIDEPLYHYIRHSDSLISRRNYNEFIEALYILKERREYLVGLAETDMSVILYGALITMAVSGINAKGRCDLKERRQYIVDYCIKSIDAGNKSLGGYRTFITNLIRKDSRLSDLMAVGCEFFRRVLTHR